MDFANARFDVIVVGAGIGGIYAIHRFRKQGLSVLGLEGAGGVGGVWYHNRYPGARVDIDSIDYCYYFSSEVYREWRWSERYATQSELLRYLNHVADKFDVKRHIRFNTWLTGAQWQPRSSRYEVTTSRGQCFDCRFLVMATGNLSMARKPGFPGLDSFRGEWVRTSHWPNRPVDLIGRRIGIIGTGSSGVQAIPILAEQASHLHVFQRTPNYSVPAGNGPMDEALWNDIRARVPQERDDLFSNRSGTHMSMATHPADYFSEAQRSELLERQWAIGGQAMGFVFTDQTTNKAANDIVAGFVRAKIRAIVRDPVVAEKLCPVDHPIGSRRLCIDTNYYQTYNRDNVTLVDVRADPIERITESGVQTRGGHYDLDLIVFALGFQAFTGAIDEAGIRNAEGKAPTDHWKRGPLTYLGLMTTGSPNLFLVTGPGSPAVLANMTIGNEFHIDWIGDCIAYMDRLGLRTIEPTAAAQDEWRRHVAECASQLLRLKVSNYMVHVNEDDQSRVFIPYTGGFGRYVGRCNAVADNAYEGFILR